MESGKMLLKTIIFSTQDSGGAGIAAYRLHQGLLNEQIDSSFYTLKASSIINNVRLFPLPNNNINYISLERGELIHPAFLRLSLLWKKIHTLYPDASPYLEAFSDYTSDINLEMIVSEIQQADVINFHWISGMIDFEKYLDLLSHKIIVWTLHDMNPFTGGCHYSFNCNRYQEKCGNCPLLNSSLDNDITREIWLKRYLAYQKLNIIVVTPSKWLARVAKNSSLFQTKTIYIIPNGVDEQVFYPLNKQNLRKQYQIPDDAFVILFGAETLSNPRKGINYLIKALQLIPSRYNIFVLTFGLPDKNLLSAIPYPTKSLGILYQESEMNEAYNLADIFILPSIAENFPNTILEALSCNIPVVAFKTGGTHDIIQHRKNGYLANIDETDLKNGILWAYHNKQLINSQDICRKTILSNYTLQHQARSYISLYRDIISAHSKQKNNVLIHLPSSNNIIKNNSSNTIKKLSLSLLQNEIATIIKNITPHINTIPRREPGEISIKGRILYYADMHSFYHEALQIFLYNLYGFRTQSASPFILDCGGHIGLASIYFAHLYPDAVIDAFEADPFIASLFKKNIKSFNLTNVNLHSSAVWIHDKGVLFNNSGDDSGHIVNNPRAINVPSIRLKDIIQDRKIDLLKLDVEGAEFHILPDCVDVLKNVNCMIIEAHIFGQNDAKLGNILSLLENTNFTYILNDLHPATWLKTQKDIPFFFCNTEKFIVTIFAWKNI